MKTISYNLPHLSDQQLVNELVYLQGKSCELLAKLLTYLAEVEKRKLYLSMGYNSLFAFAVQYLHFSEDEAGKRIAAMRTAQKYRDIYELLATGKIHLTAINMLAPHLTSANAGDLLQQASGKTKNGIEHLLVSYFPKPDVKTTLKACLPTSANSTPNIVISPSASNIVAQQPNDQLTIKTEQQQQIQLLNQPQQQRACMQPLSATSYKLTMTLSSRAKELLLHAQDLLAHQIKPGDFNAVIEKALEELCNKLEQKQLGKLRPKQRKPANKNLPAPERIENEVLAKSAAAVATTIAEVAATTPKTLVAATATTTKDDTATPAKLKRSRYISPVVKRAVVARDSYRCSFVGSHGQCSATAYLQFHHVLPYAQGGENTAANIKLFCAQHNQHQAFSDFGAEVYAAKTFVFASK